jgi:hypothetical protein
MVECRECGREYDPDEYSQCPVCHTVPGERPRLRLQPRFQPLPPGMHSNAAITARNGGVQHQFIDDIGGCSANYR